MPTDLMTIAERVTEFIKERNPEISFAPEYDLGELSSKKCVVVPLACDPKPICRNSKIHENVSRIEIGFLWRGKNIKTSQLIAEVLDVANKFQHFKVNNAVCIKIDHDPLYDPEQIRQRNQFTSVITLTFKEICYA